MLDVLIFLINCLFFNFKFDNNFSVSSSEKNKNLSQEFMKMKAKKVQNEQIMTEFFLDLIMISKKTFAFNSKVCHAVNILSNTAAVVWSVFVLVEGIF
jgi:hypothetical protein